MAGVPLAVKTTLTELGDSRVRLQVEVPAEELEGRLEGREDARLLCLRRRVEEEHE